MFRHDARREAAAAPGAVGASEGDAEGAGCGGELEPEAADDASMPLGEENEKGAVVAPQSKGLSKGVCDRWKKKGKCRKGERCPYVHDAYREGSAAAVGGGHNFPSTKRRRIDGNALIHAKSGHLRSNVQ